jgi:hypothetical protein
LSGDLGELRGGSKVTGGLLSRGLANVAVRDWSDDFTFIIGDRRYQCRSSVAQFLSPLVSKLHSIDATISELRLGIEDPERLFGSVLETGKGNSIAVDSTHRQTFAGICAAPWNSELYRSFDPELGDEIAMENAIDRLGFLSGFNTRRNRDAYLALKYIAVFLPSKD